MKLNLMIRFVVMVGIFCMGCGFGSHKKEAIVEPGDVIYHYQNGIFQCLSEEDASGSIAILLKSLKDNTKVTFDKIEFKSD
jgi:hypothetical protein